MILKTRDQNLKGFTLVEAMVAGVILSVVGYFFIRTFTQYLKAVNQIGNLGRELQFVQTLESDMAQWWIDNYFSKYYSQCNSSSQVSLPPMVLSSSNLTPQLINSENNGTLLSQITKQIGNYPRVVSQYQTILSRCAQSKIGSLSVNALLQKGGVYFCAYLNPSLQVTNSTQGLLNQVPVVGEFYVTIIDGVGGNAVACAPPNEDPSQLPAPYNSGLTSWTSQKQQPLLAQVYSTLYWPEFGNHNPIFHWRSNLVTKAYMASHFTYTPYVTGLTTACSNPTSTLGRLSNQYICGSLAPRAGLPMAYTSIQLVANPPNCTSCPAPYNNTIAANLAGGQCLCAVAIPGSSISAGTPLVSQLWVEPPDWAGQAGSSYPLPWPLSNATFVGAAIACGSYQICNGVQRLYAIYATN